MGAIIAWAMVIAILGAVLYGLMFGGADPSDMIPVSEAHCDERYVDLDAWLGRHIHGGRQNARGMSRVASRSHQTFMGH